MTTVSIAAVRALLSFVLLTSLSGQDGAKAAASEHWIVSKTVVIDAPADKVWRACKMLRSTDTQKHHVVSKAGTTTQVCESFAVPVLGPVSCTYAEKEIELKSVEYHLVSSSNFVAFEGSWQFVPLNSKQTSVTLTSFADTGSQIPFASKITRKQIVQSVDQRISDLKAQAESRSLAAALPN